MLIGLGLIGGQPEGPGDIVAFVFHRLLLSPRVECFSERETAIEGAEVQAESGTEQSGDRSAVALVPEGAGEDVDSGEERARYV